MRDWTFQRIAARGAAFLLCVVVSTLSVQAQRPDPPPFYAIQNARIVTSPGETLENATLLIADGLIEAIGQDLEVPADAWVLDGQGLTVYPGLIDAMTDLGLSASDDGGGRRGPGASPGPQIRGPEDRPGTTPWRSAADLLSSDDSRIESWRKAGFTTAVAAPQGGFFPGQAAILQLGDSEPRDRVLATPVAQRIELRGGSSGFPRSLMGGIAYVRQVLSDARYYDRALALYEKSPLGRERPTYDRSLAPIREALSARLPFLMPAHHGREIDRVLALAEAWDFRPVLHGGHGAYARLDALEQSKSSLLVSLDWPEAEKNQDPDADTPLPTIYHRRKAVTVPSLLADAGVPFAFFSAELASPDKMFAGVRQAIAAGLSAEDALAALTIQPARIFGVDDRLGTLETGKIANLILASAEPWAKDVEVRAVFVDGRKYEERRESEEQEPPASDVSGTWSLVMESPRGSFDITAELEMSSDGKVTGELSSERGTRTLEKGRMSGDQLTFKTTNTRGERSFQASYNLNVTGESLSGTMSAGPRTMELSGERTAEATAEAKTADEPAVTLAELEQAMKLYQGPVRDLDRFAITNARVYTVSGETLDNASVLVAGGKIRAVGRDLEIPADTEIFDAQGGSLIPGIIDAHSHISTEGGVNEGTLAVTSMVSIQDVIEPEDIAIYRALAGGVTTINILHGSANPIGGGNAVIKLRWGQNADGLRMKGAPSGIKFALGENPKRSRSSPRPGVPQRYPATRMGVMDVIRQAFSEAREYQDAWKQHKGSKGSLPPRTDYRLESLVEVLEGERLVHSHCYRADEILQLLRLAEDFGFRIATLQHVLEGYKVADEIAAHGAGASTFSDWWGFKVEAYDAIPYNAALMTERGVVVSINSDSGEEMRHLNQEAAKAMKWGGLDEIAALRLVTLNPAIHLGIAERVGSIEVGKDADLTLYDGPPLSIYSVVQKTFVDGDLYFDLAADRKRQAAIDAIKDKLSDKDEDDASENEEESSEPDDAADAEEASAPPPPPPEAGFDKTEVQR